MLAWNEPSTSRVAPELNTTPFGLRKNRLAGARITPSIVDTSAPVMRARMFWMALAVVNSAVSPPSSENREKLWKRLSPTFRPIASVML